MRRAANAELQAKVDAVHAEIWQIKQQDRVVVEEIELVRSYLDRVRTISVVNSDN